MFYQRRPRRLRIAPTAFPVLALMLGFCQGTALVALSPRLFPAWAPLLLSPLCGICPPPWRGFLGGCLLGIGWATFCGHRLLEQWLPPECERLPLTLRGHVASVPEVSAAPGDRRVQRFLLDVSKLEPASCRGPGRVRLSYYGNIMLAPGQYGEFSALLRVPWGLANPGGGNRESWYAMQGIHATGSVRRLSLKDAPERWRYHHHRVRASLQQSIDTLQGDSRSKALLAALTLGARDQLSPADWTLLKELGVVHLAVISGLHVSLAAAAGAVVGRLLARAALLAHGGVFWRQLPGILALGSAVTYAALAGFSLPTVRALIMLAAVVVALAIGREAFRPYTLVLSAFVLVLFQPLAMTSSGFWLSLGAVTALLWFVAWQPRRPPITIGLRVHVYLCVAMLPLTAWWFGGGSIIAPLANAVAVPVIGLLVVPMTLLASVLDTASPAVSRWLWQWPLALLQGLLVLADGLAAQTAGLRYQSLAGSAYAAINASLAVILFGVRLPLQLKFAAGCLLLPLLLRQPVLLSPDRPELAVLDVGQGTSVVVSDGRRTLVYDTGGGQPGGYTAAGAALIPFLRQRGIETIDTLVVSHADRDHSAGTEALLEAFPVGRLLFGQQLKAVPRGNPCRTGAAWSWSSGVSFQVLATAQEAGASANDASCVLKVDLAGHRFLLPGDISGARERDLIRYWREGLQSDWLLAAHHGSGSSTTAAWLRAVGPVGVILNHGRANPFGHPHPDVMARLHRRGIATRSTAREGALVFRVTPGGDLEVTATRSGLAPFWRPPG